VTIGTAEVVERIKALRGTNLPGAYETANLLMNLPDLEDRVKRAIAARR
jgi:hypothetical protein